MKVDRLTLRGFRNYQDLSCDFVPGVNLLLGDNANGKTNLLEALYYLSVGRAFRTRKEAELISFGAELADLEAEVTGTDRTQTLRAVLFAGRRPRQLYLGGVKKKAFSDLAGTLTTVLFCPDDLQVLKAGSTDRRKLLDDALCQLRPKYAAALEEYQRLLRQKGEVLRQQEEHPEYRDILPEYDLRMAELGAVIVSTRAKYLRSLETEARTFHKTFSGDKETLSLTYETVSTVQNPFAPLTTIYGWLREHQESHRRAELESCQCLSGPHKDDFTAAINDLPVKAFASQGQTRTAAISLKLAQRELFRQDTGEEPVLLLDDVLSELDQGRQDFVLNQIRTGQVFITCCDRDRYSDLGKVFQIENGVLT